MRAVLEASVLAKQQHAPLHADSASCSMCMQGSSCSQHEALHVAQQHHL